MKFLAILLLLPLSTLAGKIKGTVSSQGKAVEYATVTVAELNYAVVANEYGHFEIPNLSKGKYTLIASGVGYKADTTTLEITGNEVRTHHFHLRSEAQQLEELTITARRNEISMDKGAIPIEHISSKLFEKNPTPSIFESISMVNGVRPQLQCAVCNTGDIHINGMEGPYTMVLIDGMPIVSALGTVYGLTGIPNSIIERVEVQKGPASTLYGSEALGGVINVITKSPDTAPAATLDIMGTSYLEGNLDAGVRYKLSKRVSGLLSGNVFYFNKKWDVNHDNFTDMTLQKRGAAFNRFSFHHKNGLVSNLAMRYYYEDRWGGELQWNKNYRGSDIYYGESIYTDRIEVIGNSPLAFLGKNVKLQYSYNRHHQNSAYGNTLYLAKQHIAFSQLTKSASAGRHKLLAGAALRFTYYDDNSTLTQKADGSNAPSNIYLPGIFVQDEYTLSPKSSLLGAIRYDYSSDSRSIFTPRVNWKFTPHKDHTFRLGVGSGYRIVNLFTEEHAVNTGSRTVAILSPLQPERSWNSTLNYSWITSLGLSSLNLDASLFFTYFQNKIVPDYFSDDNKIFFDNLKGYGVNRGIGVQAQWQAHFPLKVMAGATFTDVFIKEREVKKPLVQTPKLTSNFLVSYDFHKPGLTFDVTGNVYSPMLLPVVENDFRPAESPWFCLLNLQVTKQIGKAWQWYGGLKNILNFLPRDPILRPDDPFDKEKDNTLTNPNAYSFDTGYNYAPLQGIRFFTGVRMKINN